MDITLIKKLREETEAGMMECKKALEDAQGNYEEAKDLILKNLKKHQGNERVASKGLLGLEILENEAIIFEVNAESDFAARNDHFKQLIKNIGTYLIKSSANYPKEALKVDIHGQSILDMINQASGLIKENLNLRRFYRIIKKDEQRFSSYVHQDGRVISLVILNKESQVAKDLAMQVAANTPVYLNLKSIDQDTINYEKFMYEKNHGSFDLSRFQDYLKSITLDEQPFIKDQNKNIKDLLAHEDIEIIDFFRFEVGQGIEDKLNCKLDIPCDGSKITVTPIYS